MTTSRKNHGILVYLLAIVALTALFAAGMHVFGGASALKSRAALAQLIPAVHLEAPPTVPAASADRRAVPPVVTPLPARGAAVEAPAAGSVAAVRAAVIEPPATPVAKAKPAPDAARPPVKAAPTAPKQAAAAGTLEVVAAAIARDVDDREPVGAATSFSADTERVWAWVKLANTGEPTTITMVWRKGTEVAFRYEVAVGASKSWRTWSRKTIRKGDVGAWSVDLLDASGALLQTLDFTVDAGGVTAG